MLYTTIATVLIIGFVFFLGARAGALRGKHGITPPKMTGNEEFEIAYRIQANSGEQLILFLPIMWLAAYMLGDIWGGAAAVVWLVGRFIYARSMRSDVSKRGTGMVITALPLAVLMIAIVVDLVMANL